MRKLLSQLPESSITVENMSDNGDVNFSLKREDMSVMCAELLEAFKALISSALASAGITAGRCDMRCYPSATPLPHLRRTVLSAVVQSDLLFSKISTDVSSTPLHTALHCTVLCCAVIYSLAQYWL
jgi:hypothetical protein